MVIPTLKEEKTIIKVIQNKELFLLQHIFTPIYNIMYRQKGTDIQIGFRALIKKTIKGLDFY